MYCTKCGKEIPNNARFCDTCGAEVRPVQPNQMGNDLEGFPQREVTTGAVGAVQPKRKTAFVVIPALVIIGLALFFVFQYMGKSDPLYGTWYISMSELTGQPISVTFTQDTVKFGAGAVQNSKEMTLKYEKVGNDTLKIYSEQGNDSAVCTYQIKDDKLYLSSPTERSLNLVFTRNPEGAKVPVN